jgi:hypothetical protein
MKFLGANRPNNLITVGFSEYNDRQYGIYDVRKVAEPLKLEKLDSVSNVAILHYDDTINTLCVIDKGSRAWHQFYYTDYDGPKLNKIDSSNNKDNTLGMYFLPKRDIDISKNELNRVWRLTGIGQAEQYSFKVPRKGAGFSPEIYPPCLSGEYAQEYEDWDGGKDVAPVFKPFNPDAVNAAAANTAL